LRKENLSKLPMAGLIGGLRQGDDALVTYSHLQGFEIEIAAMHLEEANLDQANLTAASLRMAHLEKASLLIAHLEGASLSQAHLEGADLRGAHLEIADLRGAHLEGANLNGADLEGADLRTAHLEGADLSDAHLDGAILRDAHLEGADLRGAFMSRETALNDVTLSHNQNSIVLFADMHWSDVNVAVVDWSALSMLGEELLARQRDSHGTKVEKLYSIELYNTAARAYRQLAVVLRNQGLNEDANRFAYRAQRMQRKVFWKGQKFWRFLGSLFLDLLAGYGYKPGRSVFWYLAIVCGFALAYHSLGQLSLFPPDAFVFSLTSFHGRGFFPGLEHKASLHDPLIILAALEAVLGLFVEISFIATFTQRFFGR
jgi:hypothetical protein